MKKWLVIVEDDQYDWIKSTAKEAGIKGSVVVRTVLEKAQKENTKEIISELKEKRSQRELEDLEDKKQQLEERIRNMKRQVKVLA